MKTSYRTNNVLLLVMAMTAFSLNPGISQAQSWFTYDPSQGTLPEAQGFSYYSDSGQPAPAITNGTLNQGLTGNYEYQYWYNTSQPVDFSKDFTMEWDGKVVTSSYYTSGFRRSGYSFDAIDSSFRTFGVGITDSGVFVWNDDDSWGGSPFINFDTTSGFNDYRLHVVNGTATLFINNNQVTSVPLGASYTGSIIAADKNEVYFGDGTHWAGSQTQVKLFRYTTNTFTVPEPGALALLTGTVVCGAGLLARRRRK